MILHGNCLEIIPTLTDNSVSGICTDPPYGENQGYEGDSSLKSAEELLYAVLRESHPKLEQNAHLVLFWTMRNLDVVIDALKATGYTYRRTLTMYLPKGNARPYLFWLPRTQAIVVGQKYLPYQPSQFHGQLAEYLLSVLEKKNISRSQVAKALGCDSRLVMKWTRVGDPEWCLPTPRFYGPLKKLLELDDDFDILLTREPGNSHKPNWDCSYHHDCYIVEQERDGEMLHPAQKPLSVMEHLIECTIRPGGTVLDPFCGSGTTGVAAKNKGRNYILIEIDKNYVELAKKRL